jgi:threonine synthase
MEAMGWIGSERPRMVSVQAAGCAPIVAAFEKGEAVSQFWQGATTLASGLRVPKALGDFIILRDLKTTGGTALAVNDDAMLAACRELASLEGIFAAPEGGACIAALRRLGAEKFVEPHHSVVVFNTGSGYKYVEAWTKALEE